MTHTERLRRTIKKALKEKGWTHYRLSKETGLTISTIDTAVNGTGDVYYETAARILSALGQSLAGSGV